MLQHPIYSATVAQLVEQTIRNRQVKGSNPFGGSHMSAPICASVNSASPIYRGVRINIIIRFLYNRVSYNLIIVICVLSISIQLLSDILHVRIVIIPSIPAIVKIRYAHRRIRLQ
jgi:hypothetical protein